MIGVHVSLMTCMIAAIPPLSEPLIPSISSIMITLFFSTLEAFLAVHLKQSSEVFVLKVLTYSSIDFLFLVSLAFISRTSIPSSVATNQAAELLPIPGGPEIKHAQAFGFGAFAQSPNFTLTSFFLPLITTSFQSLNHSQRESIAALFPINSYDVFGWYFSVHIRLSDILRGSFGFGVKDGVSAYVGFRTIDLSFQFLQFSSWKFSLSIFSLKNSSNSSSVSIFVPVLFAFAYLPPYVTSHPSSNLDPTIKMLVFPLTADVVQAPRSRTNQSSLSLQILSNYR